MNFAFLLWSESRALEPAGSDAQVSERPTKKTAAGHFLKLSVGEDKAMRRQKPDLLWVLVIVFSLGMVTTGYTQGLWDRQSEAPAAAQQR